MHRGILEGEEFVFVGFDGDLDHREEYENTTAFFSEEEVIYVALVAYEDDIIVDQYHREFMTLVLKEILASVEAQKMAFSLDLDTMLKSIEGYGTLFGVWVTKGNIFKGKAKFKTIYNTGILVDYSLIPVDNLVTEEPHSVFYYRGQRVLRFGTEIERFPSHVSYTVLTREMGKLLMSNALGYKIMEVERLLSIGLTLERYGFV